MWRAHPREPHNQLAAVAGSLDLHPDWQLQDRLYPSRDLNL